jgi:hypothetical protein
MFRVLAAAAALALVVASAAAGARHAGATGTVHVVEHAVSDVVSNGTAKDVVGNVLTFANPVFDGVDKKQIGRDSGFCVRTRVAHYWECMWTTFLPTGQITVQGPFSDTGNTRLAITGGTGAYADSRGWMGLLYHDKKGTKFDFFFHLD